MLKVVGCCCLIGEELLVVNGFGKGFAILLIAEAANRHVLEVARGAGRSAVTGHAPWNGKGAT